MQKEIENYLEVGTKIKLKQKMGFLNTIGKEYVISNVDKKNKTVCFSVPFSDYSSQIFKDVSTVENQFNGMLLCTASLSFDELLKYFTIVLEKEKEWSYIDDHGNIRHTTSKWSEWLYKNADLIYNSIYEDSSSIIKCKYRISKDGQIQMRSIRFVNREVMIDFQKMLYRKEKSYFASSYAICNKQFDIFSLDFGLEIAKMRMRKKLAEIEYEFTVKELHEDDTRNNGGI